MDREYVAAQAAIDQIRAAWISHDRAGVSAALRQLDKIAPELAVEALDVLIDKGLPWAV